MVHFSHKTSKRKMWFFYAKRLIFIGNDTVLNSKFTMAKELSLLFTQEKKNFHCYFLTPHFIVGP